jgi:uncharacterized protein YjbI with pentapeptide repeats
MRANLLQRITLITKPSLLLFSIFYFVCINLASASINKANIPPVNCNQQPAPIGQPAIPINWSGCTISNPDFLTNVNLENAILTNTTFNASLSEVDMQSASAEGAQFNYNITNSNLSSADFTSANFAAGAGATGQQTISNVNFSNSYFLNARFAGSIREYNTPTYAFAVAIDDSDFTNANLPSAQLCTPTNQYPPLTVSLTNDTFTGTDFPSTCAPYSGAVLFLDFKGLGNNWAGANFSYAQLEGVDLSGLNFSLANFSNANFAGANLQSTDFESAELVNADFVDAVYAPSDAADAANANFDYADLAGAVLASPYIWMYANFDGAQFVGADLSGVQGGGLGTIGVYRGTYIGANFTNANLTGAEFYITNLTDADFKGAITGTSSIPSPTVDASFPGFKYSTLTGSTWFDGTFCSSGTPGVCVGYGNAAVKAT